MIAVSGLELLVLFWSLELITGFIAEGVVKS